MMSSYLLKTIGLLLALLAFTTATLAGGKPAIAISEFVPFSENASTEVGLTSPRGFTRDRIELECDLGLILSESVVKAAQQKGIPLLPTAEIEKAPGMVLSMKIEGARGDLGGSMSGTKSLTVRGELREGDTLIGSFVARRQQTALTQSTCESLVHCVKKIAKDIGKWLKDPVPKARLGSA
jgi:hypothetical protein